MPEVVVLSNIENMEKLKTYLGELLKKGRYDEMTQAIGSYSLFIDPQHTRNDQSQLFHYVLDLLKGKISKKNNTDYSSWLSAFPKLMGELAESHTVVTDRAAADALASRHSGYGPFRSVDEFFAWALEDRRLPLDNIVKYIEKTVEMQRGKA
jgi:hypothetical protein